MPFRVAMMLAGFAQVERGQLTVLNAGWAVRDPEPQGGAAIGIMIYVPRSHLGKEIEISLELMDSNGEPMPVEVLDADGNAVGKAPIEVEGRLAASGSDDPQITIPVSLPLAVNLPRFRLPAGQEFHWQLRLDGEAHPDWVLPFRTTPPEPE